MELRTLAVLALPLLVCAVALAASPPGPPDGWTDRYIHANGIRLHYYRALPAAGKPVMVMVHGVTDNGLCWATIASKLQNAYDIYMIDARGHGLSDPFTSADNGDTLVNDVVEFVRVMKFEKPILVGHSMGAATLMRVAAEHPDLAKAVVMLDPFLTGVQPRRPPASRAAPSTAPDRLIINMNGSPETLVSQNNYSFDDLVATGRRQFPKWDLSAVRYWALSKKQYHGAYTYEAWQVMSGTMRTGDALGRIRVPALVLKADAPAAQRQANEEAAKVIQKGRLVHVDGGGHNLHQDEPQRTIDLLTEFLSTL